MDKWNKLASRGSIDRTIVSLKENGINAKVVETGQDAKREVLSLIPEGAEVMAMTSTTLDTLGISQEINQSGKYNSVRNKLNSLSRETQNLEMQKLAAAPEYALGSVHAISEDGYLLIASNSGSQLPAYVYGSTHVIWVVGSQKIVKNIDLGMRRIRDYTFRLEDERAKKAYGVGSGVNKILIVNKKLLEP